MDVATFRQNFPEFINPANYPDSSVTFWLNLATKLLRPDRWVDILDEGIQLFTAHNLALERAAQQGNGKGVPGLNSGLVSAKQIDKLSISYNTTVGLVENAGNFNLTTYGTRFWWLMNMAGMGAVQAGAGPVVVGNYGAGYASPFWVY